MKVTLLAVNGADVDASEPAYGCTALHVACINNHPDCVEALVRGGCAPSSPCRTQPEAIRAI